METRVISFLDDYPAEAYTAVRVLQARYAMWCT